MSRLHADLALVFAAAVWGIAFLFQKSAMDHVGPLLFVAARATVAVLALLALALREARRAGVSAEPDLWWAAVLGGAAFFLGAWLQQEGIKTATVTNTSFLTTLYVIVTPFVAWLVMGKAPAWMVWIAALLSVLGTWLLGGGTLAAFSMGDMLVAGSAVFWAIHVVITGTAGRYRRPIGYTVVQFATVGALGASGAMVMEQVSLDGLRHAAVDIAYVGVLSTALTFTLLTVALQHTPPAEAAVIVSTEVVFASAAAYLVLGERLTPIGWAGAGTILVAILLVQLGPALVSSRCWRGKSAAAKTDAGRSQE